MEKSMKGESRLGVKASSLVSKGDGKQCPSISKVLTVNKQCYILN